MAQSEDENPTDSTVVGNTGDARWSVPIEVPPGPGGFQPNLALTYSSSRGDGPFGVGWTLDLGEVKCSTRFGVSPYITNPGSSDPCPQFEMDGELLNYSGPDGSADSYHTFIESFQEILDLGANGWKVTGTDGMIRRYGESANSRIVGPSEKVVRWLLSSIENPWGQKIFINYDGDPDTLIPLDPPVNGHTYLKAILYGPTLGKVIEFIYEERDDVISDFAGGVGRWIDLRASEIKITVGQSQHSRYLLGYDLTEIGVLPATTYSTNRSRLSWVQRFGAGCDDSDPVANCTAADGLALPPQVFRYSDPNDAATTWVQDDNEFTGPDIPLDALVSYWPMIAPSATQSGDVNGDGLIDIIQSDNGWMSTSVLINTGSGWAFDSGWTDRMNALTFQAPRVDVEYAPPGAHFAIGICEASYSLVSMGVAFADIEWGFPINVRFGETFPWPPQLPVDPWAALGGTFRLADMNGDGLADLVMSVRMSGIYRTHDCTSGSPVPLSEPEYINPPVEGVKVVFRNTGDPATGWVLDPSLAEDLPWFGMVITESEYALYEIWGLYDSYHCRGFIGPQYAPQGIWEHYPVFPCVGLVDLSPQFADLNGDGRLDIITEVPDDYNVVMVDQVAATDPPVQYAVPAGSLARTASQAWISQEDGSWQHDPSFDLPFHHASIAWQPSGSANSWNLTSEIGVRIVDRNRDGLADVTWLDHGFGSQDSPYPPAPGGVLLNKGGGDGQPYSAWCSSRALDPSTSVEECSEASRFELPEESAPFGVYAGFVLKLGTELADLNGDGWLDVVNAQHSQWPFAIRSFLYSPDGTWVEDSRFTPPAPVGSYYSQLSDRWVYTNTHVFDADGDGAADFVRGDDWELGPPAVWLGQRGLSDLLRSVDNGLGAGGVTSIAYDGAPRQRDDAPGGLEDEARTHAETAGIDEPVGPVGMPNWAPTPVVSKVTINGPNRESADTFYRYGDSRWCPHHRSLLGYRLVEKTLPDSSVVTSFFYQKHGRAGRLSEKITWSSSGSPLQFDSEQWDLPPPGSVTGAWDGGGGLSDPSPVGQLKQRTTRNEYGSTVGAETGAEQVEIVTYNDGYGYNFVSRIDVDRPSGLIERHFTPEPRTAKDVVGLVAASHEARGSDIWNRHIYQYVPEGKPSLDRRVRIRVDDGVQSVANDDTLYDYDAYGNVSLETDPRGNSTQYLYDPGGSAHRERIDPASNGSATGKHTVYQVDPIFVVQTQMDSDYADVPGWRVVLDGFGRVVERWIRTVDGTSEELASTVEYVWAYSPYVTEVEYANSLGDGIRTYTVDDGFGGTWKAIREQDGSGDIGRGVFHNPITRTTRITHDLECPETFPEENPLDVPCAGYAMGQWEDPATVTVVDPLRRPVTVDTPDGTSSFVYSASQEQVVSAPGVVAAHWVDVEWAENAKGDLTKRYLDGDRLMAVDECGPGSSLVNGCQDPDRTLYGYHGNGQLEIIYDAVAVAPPSNWSAVPSETSQNHFLRYHFDTSGNVSRIDDPDAGRSDTFYDGNDNVIQTVNARDQVRLYVYDHLDRLTQIGGPEPYTITYRPDELQQGGESTTGYSTTLHYDVYGRLKSENVVDGGVSIAGPETTFDLLDRPVQIKYRSIQFPLATLRYEYSGAYLKRLCRLPAWGATEQCGATGNQDILADVTYDDLGRRKTMVLPGGTRTFSYADDVEPPGDDPTRHLKRDEFTGGSGYYVKHHYSTHDPLGNVLTWSTQSATGDLDEPAGAYAYDHRNRIQSWTRGGSTETFGYDRVGNLIAHRSDAQFTQNQIFAHTTKPHAITFRTSGLVDYEYDASGNLIRSGPRHYQFDSASRMTCVGTSPGSCDTLQLFYDSNGKRVREVASGTTRRFLGDGLILTSDPINSYRIEISAFGERVGFSELFWNPGIGGWNVTDRWVLTDRLGTGLAVIDKSGQTVRHTRFRPFGEVDDEETSGSTAGRRHYAGHPQQEETGLVYMMARWQNPKTGTFLSVDPLIVPSDPQSHTGYTYARNNPVSSIDPTGLFTQPEVVLEPEAPPPDVEVMVIHGSGYYNPMIERAREAFSNPCVIFTDCGMLGFNPGNTAVAQNQPLASGTIILADAGPNDGERSAADQRRIDEQRERRRIRRENRSRDALDQRRSGEGSRDHTQARKGPSGVRPSGPGPGGRERNVGITEEHSRVPKGSRGLPRRVPGGRGVGRVLGPAGILIDIGLEALDQAFPPEEPCGPDCT